MQEITVFLKVKKHWAFSIAEMSLKVMCLTKRLDADRAAQILFKWFVRVEVCNE